MLPCEERGRIRSKPSRSSIEPMCNLEKYDLALAHPFRSTSELCYNHPLYLLQVILTVHFAGTFFGDCLVFWYPSEQIWGPGEEVGPGPNIFGRTPKIRVRTFFPVILTDLPAYIQGSYGRKEC